MVMASAGGGRVSAGASVVEAGGRLMVENPLPYCRQADSSSPCCRSQSPSRTAASHSGGSTKSFRRPSLPTTSSPWTPAACAMILAASTRASITRSRQAFSLSSASHSTLIACWMKRRSSAIALFALPLSNASSTSSRIRSSFTRRRTSAMQHNSGAFRISRTPVGISCRRTWLTSPEASLAWIKTWFTGKAPGKSAVNVAITSLCAGISTVPSSPMPGTSRATLKGQ
mmetsp:Transcript_6885/g.16227  ORF Transcript_6885/g.16227 Transcript_6885/m.16227 type:complete len:228 (+) Transcript_6885:272-955(+)